MKKTSAPRYARMKRMGKNKALQAMDVLITVKMKTSSRSMILSTSRTPRFN